MFVFYKSLPQIHESSAINCENKCLFIAAIKINNRLNKSNSYFRQLHINFD